MLNISTKVDNTPGANGQLTASEYNDHNVEIQKCVTKTGQTLSGSITDQLSRSETLAGALAQSYINSSVNANVITLTPETGTNGLVMPDSYAEMQGYIVHFYNATPNTSTSVTCNIGQTTGTLLGAKSVVGIAAATLVVGQLAGWVKLRFDTAHDRWEYIRSTYDITNLQNQVAFTTILKSASYPITDTDGYKRIEVDTTSGDITITMPLMANNIGRRIEIANVKGGTNKVIIVPHATDATKLTPDDLAVIWLPKKGDRITFQQSSNSGFWEVIDEHITCSLFFSTYAGFGSTDNKIIRYTNLITTGNLISENHTAGYSSSTQGLQLTINKTGNYIIKSISSRAGTQIYIGVTKNTTQKTTSIINLSNFLTECKSIIYYPSGGAGTTECCEYLVKGDVIYSHSDGSALDNAVFQINYLG